MHGRRTRYAPVASRDPWPRFIPRDERDHWSIMSTDTASAVSAALYFRSQDPHGTLHNAQPRLYAMSPEGSRLGYIFVPAEATDTDLDAIIALMNEPLRE